MVRKDGLPAGIWAELTTGLVIGLVIGSAIGSVVGLFKGLGTGFATVSYTFHNSGLIVSIITLKERFPTHIHCQFFATLKS
jgi:hypothetical protein